ncbi:MAG: hypothetical protein ACODAJ_10925, partial [Planctomycetota bacterium]
RAVAAHIEPLDALERLPLDGAATSFFIQEGGLEGFVKGASKPLEMVFLGWSALDPHVGRDKKLGPHEQVGTRFYTRLRPWLHDETDLWHFARCLAWYGWDL